MATQTITATCGGETATTTVDVPDVAVITLSADGAEEAMIHAGATTDTVTIQFPTGLPSPPATLNVTGPDSFAQSFTGDADEEVTLTAPADGDYTITDPRTTESVTITFPTTQAEGTQLGGVRVGYWLRADSDPASLIDVGYHVDGLDPAADPTDGTLAPGGFMQWRSLDGQTYTLTFTNEQSTETVVTMSAGDPETTVTIAETVV